VLVLLPKHILMKNTIGGSLTSKRIILILLAVIPEYPGSAVHQGY
jgi:hypothetical protein